MDVQSHLSFGVFKPVGYVLVSFPSAAQAEAAVQALVRLGLGLDAAAIHRWSDRQMMLQIDDQLEHASPLAAVGQELNLIKAHRALAEQGYHFLAVPAGDNDSAARVAECVKPLAAERAQYYGHFLIEELISHAGDPPQVAESPDRGLDAQTPSGQEAERARLRPTPPA